MRKLIEDFGFSVEDAAAIMGNAGHESGGLTQLQELAPVAGAGGWGWFQWTGPRRRAFDAYCNRNGLDPKSDKANYGFLFVELSGPESGAVAKTKAARTLEDKVKAFELSFERAGVKAYASRIEWAKRALDAWNASGQGNVPAPPDVPAPEPIPAPKPEPKPAPKPVPAQPGIVATIFAAILAMFAGIPLWAIVLAAGAVIALIVYIARKDANA
jgi:hypothetical protein